jgi:protein-export membrane protein SecD
MKTWKIRIIALLILIISAGIGYGVYQTEITGKKPFKLGLDLSGGASLIYRADLKNVATSDVNESLSSLRSVLEDRVNTFGIAEPVVATETALTSTGRESRVNIQLPGVKDLDAAIKMIGETPVLEFRTENPSYNPDATKNLVITPGMMKNGTIDLSSVMVNLDPYVTTQLTGRYLSRANLQFDPQTQQPVIALQFNTEGSKLFEEITKANIGKTVAIYLDGKPLSTPRVNETISGGQAVITGDFTPDEAKGLVTRLNSGALPVPIELVSTEAVGPTLGSAATRAGVMAGLIALLLISILLVIWYRLPGIIAVLSLGIYTIIMLAVFKYIPITLTSAGIAGMIISLGMAVDANILIFERMREELQNGKHIPEAIKTGFDRAWTSIRDGNISSLISAAVLYFAGTFIMKGFAVTFGIGVFVSMITAITISRTLLRNVHFGNGRITKFLFGTGLSK